ncbi:hypothetical protein KP509_07G057800 [Ceratopteris richardii]|uniref:RING-type E3 ubiquitin transferase n=1 Tax=Ceratopteris richardii TaxID=49495 RepID=A0A8T2UF84_CERRI|nr:hypothetical protein KP509_07G057800 [Ceratopteris richardii]
MDDYTQQSTRRLLQETAAGLLASSPSFSTNNDDQQDPTDAINFKLSPATVIIFAALIMAFFFMALFSVCFGRRCSSADDSVRAGGAADQSRPNGAPFQGVDPAFLEKLPLVVYSSSKKRGSNVDCVVCLVDFEEGETLCQLPKCKHVFHKDCIDMWLSSHTTCPLCRYSLISGSTRSFSWGSASRSLRLALARLGTEQGSGINTGPPTPMDDHARLQNEAELAYLHRHRSGRLPRSHSTGHSLVKQSKGISREATIAEEARSSASDSAAGGACLPIASVPLFRRSQSYAAAGGEAMSTYMGISNWMRGAGAMFKRTLSIKKVNAAAVSSSSAMDTVASFQRMDRAEC